MGQTHCALRQRKPKPQFWNLELSGSDEIGKHAGRARGTIGFDQFEFHRRM
jgi:hypothetical protein